MDLPRDHDCGDSQDDHGQDGGNGHGALRRYQKVAAGSGGDVGFASCGSGWDGA
jgi:hypothetical protein